MRELLFQALFKYFLLKNDEHKMRMNQTYLTTCKKAYLPFLTDTEITSERALYHF